MSTIQAKATNLFQCNYSFLWSHKPFKIFTSYASKEWLVYFTWMFVCSSLQSAERLQGKYRAILSIPDYFTLFRSPFNPQPPTFYISFIFF